MALAFLFLPGVLFGLGLWALRNDPRFPWLGDVRAYPFELWIIAAFGAVATIAGALDWRFHRTRAPLVGAPEHRAHLLALGAGGGSLFALLGLASLSSKPGPFLVPVVASALFTCALIAYDELVFHRRRHCGRYEAMLHRVLILGNGTAFLAWVHWCFVRCSCA